MASLGPYVSGGVRTEQIFLYTSAAVVLLLRKPDRQFTTPVSRLLRIWAIYLTLIGAATVVQTIAPPDTTWRLEYGSVVAGIDNVLVPLAVLVIVSRVCSRQNTHHALDAVTLAIVAASAIAATTAWLQAFHGYTFERWWSSAPGPSTSEMAATNGRYSGLFNQPAEAGLFFGIALLSSIYLLRNRPFIAILGGLFAIVGGALAVSKILIFVALPLALMLLMRTSDKRKFQVVAGLGLAALAGAFFANRRVNQWPGLQQLQETTSVFVNSPVSAVSAGRFGESSTLASTVAPTLSSSPILGFGAGGLDLPYDNAWVEALVLSGVLGVGVLSLVLMQWFKFAWEATPSIQRDLLFVTVTLTFVSCLGIPALTANRASATVWLLITMLVLVTHPLDPRVNTSKESLQDVARR